MDDRFFLCDLTDFEGIRKAVDGEDVVVHLGADPSGDSWESILSNNIIGTYNVFEACIQADESLQFEIFYGMSDNDLRWVDIENARQKVGYIPQDRAEEHYNYD